MLGEKSAYTNSSLQVNEYFLSKICSAYGEQTVILYKVVKTGRACFSYIFFYFYEIFNQAVPLAAAAHCGARRRRFGGRVF